MRNIPNKYCMEFAGLVRLDWPAKRCTCVRSAGQSISRLDVRVRLAGQPLAPGQPVNRSVRIFRSKPGKTLIRSDGQLVIFFRSDPVSHRSAAGQPPVSRGQLPVSRSWSAGRSLSRSASAGAPVRQNFRIIFCVQSAKQEKKFSGRSINMAKYNLKKNTAFGRSVEPDHPLLF